MRKLIVIFLMVLGSACARTSLGSNLITFDDLPGSGSSLISNGYGGLNWSNFYYLNGAKYPYQPNGYHNGIVSPNNVALNGYGVTAMNSMNGSTFEFNSAYFTGAWNDGLQVTVQGYDNSTLLDSVTFTVNTSGPTLETFNWSGVNELAFSSTGGTHNPNFAETGTEFAMDNFVYSTPEPGTFVLGALGAIGLLGFRRLLSSNGFGR